MGLKVFLDDVRNAPDNSWVVVRDPNIVKGLIISKMVDEISFDHDLGEGVCNGYDIMLLLEELVYNKIVKAPIVYVHSANLGARSKMEQCAQKINNMRPV